MARKAPGAARREGIGLMELTAMFPDEASATAWFEKLVWPDGRRCPHCGGAETAEASATKKQPYWCSPCRKGFSVRIGTPLERSRIPLRKWVFAIYLEMTGPRGVSSAKLHRDLRVTQKTAWFMLRRIREAWSFESSSPFAGPNAAGSESAVGVRETERAAARRVRSADGPRVVGFVAKKTATACADESAVPIADNGLPSGKRSG